MSRGRSRSAGLALVLCGALAVAGCGGDDGDGPDASATTTGPAGATAPAGTTGSGSTTAPDAGGTQPAGGSWGPTDDPVVLARRCTDLLNARDRATYEAGRKAALDVVHGAVGSRAQRTGEAERAAWRTALTKARDALAGERDRLAAMSDAAGWKAVVQPLSDRIAGYERRIAVTESADWPPSRDALQIGAPDGVADPAALERLGLEGRDCEALGGDPGPDPAHADVVRRAALVCSAIVDRRAAADYDATARVVLGAVEDVARKRPVRATDEREAALRTLRDEWRRTADDLAEIPTTEVPDADAWKAVVDLAGDRASGYERRLRAMESGDADEIAATFKDFRRVMGAPGWEFEPVGLAARDCRSLKS